MLRWRLPSHITGQDTTAVRLAQLVYANCIPSEAYTGWNDFDPGHVPRVPCPL